jgi:hypothetical protein
LNFFANKLQITLQLQIVAVPEFFDDFPSLAQVGRRGKIDQVLLEISG